METKRAEGVFKGAAAGAADASAQQRRTERAISFDPQRSTLLSGFNSHIILPHRWGQIFLGKNVGKKNKRKSGCLQHICHEIVVTFS